MQFEDWNKLNEALSTGDVDTAVAQIALAIEQGTGKKLMRIPELDEFTRPGEPKQRGYLLAAADLRSVKLNFTESKELYSIDFWKSTDVGNPTATLYLEDLSFEEALPKIVALFKNPSRNAKIEEDGDDVKMTTPKKPEEANKTVKAAQRKFEYEFGDPRVIFDDLTTYIDMVVDGEMNALLLTGQAGVGKTFLVTKRLTERGLKRNEDYFKITGKTTAAGIYLSLYEHNGKLLLYDDCDSVFGDKNGVNVLKGALDTSTVREVAWPSASTLKTSSGEKAPKHFEFTGRVIFISNIPKKSKSIDSAIRSRSFILEIALTPEDMLQRMWSILPVIKMPTGTKVRGPVKDRAMELLVEAAEETPDVDLNLRTLLKAIAIANRIPGDYTAKRLIKQQCSTY